MMRIILFLITNLAVMLVFGLILNVTGIESNNINNLIIISGLVGFGGAFFSLLTSKWISLHAVGGEIVKNPTNETESWLVKTVSLQSKKAGIAMPQLAIYPSVDINAFATGARRNSSLIAVSTGLLQNLSQDEAEAVLAHEISHISNGDMVTMTLIQGVVNTFVIFISRFIAHLVAGALSSINENEHGSEGEGKINNGNPLVYLIISTILELIFGILASIITMWFSRHREFRADAGSAKQVGSKKMIAALQKLKNSHEPQEPSNMIAFCINGKNNSFSELFMSHPPIDQRIEALRKGEYF